MDMALPEIYKWRLSAVISCLLFPLTFYGQIEIVGSSRSGGPDQLGTLFSILDDGSGYDQRSDFVNNREGANPKTTLFESAEGVIYGTTSSGGENNGGTFFKLENEIFTKIFDFAPNIHGSNSQSNLIEIGNGEFVTANASGGSTGSGVLVRLTDAGEAEVLHTFSGSVEGSNPRGHLAYDPSSETVFGTCSNGGPAGFGTLYSFNLSTETFSVLHVFTSGDAGAFPQGGLLLASDGLLYGTTQFGGTDSQGLIFSYDADTDDYLVRYNFDNATSDGRYPFGPLTETASGAIIGTCSEGGTGGTGTVFSLSDSGVFSRLYSFSAGADGGFPKSGITIGSDGWYYGVTEFGAANGFGSIYRVNDAGVFSKLNDMQYTEEGSNPVANLIELEGSVFLGCASSGGGNNFGTIFTYEGGEVEKIHDFSLPLQGAEPAGLLLSGPDLFGVTTAGGTFNTGIFFKSDISGEREKLHDFQGTTDGQNPNGILVEQNGMFYGTARFGGENQAGTVYAISATGDFSLLHAFEGGENGEFPRSGLCPGDDGYFYGTTSGGGSFDDGILYRVDEIGNFEKLHDFFGFFDGAAPKSGLIAGEDGILYGLTEEGGSSSAGVLYEYDPSTAALTVLHHFDFVNDGANPLGDLLLHSDGRLYGTTGNGASGDGTLFRFDAESGLEVLHEFDEATDGGMILHGLTEDIEGRVYGFCSEGGEFNAGTAFIYSDDTGFEKLFDFSAANSAAPLGKPVLFYPECISDDECTSSDPCAVAICTFGECEEIAIDPQFTAIEIGSCEDDLYELTVTLDLAISPGGSILIEGSEFPLTDATSYNFTLTDLPADGESIELAYTFSETGCQGLSNSLGSAPAPCPPIETTFVVDVTETEVSPEGIHLGGDFQGWTPGDLPMTETVPGIWEISLEIPAGDYEFNFFNGSSLFDGEYVVGDCAVNGKRQLTISEASETLEYCWESCGLNCTLSASNLKESEEIKLYPNPIDAGNDLNLLFPTALVRTYTLSDIQGKIIRQGQASSKLVTINTTGLEPGYYLIFSTDGSDGMRTIGKVMIR